MLEVELLCQHQGASECVGKSVNYNGDWRVKRKTTPVITLKNRFEGLDRVSGQGKRLSWTEMSHEVSQTSKPCALEKNAAYSVCVKGDSHTRHLAGLVSGLLGPDMRCLASASPAQVC